MKHIGLDVGNGSICFSVRGEDKNVISAVYPSVYGVYEDHDNIAVGGGTIRAVQNVFSLGDYRYILGYDEVRNASSIPISAYDRDNRVERREFRDLVALALMDAATRDCASDVIQVELSLGVPAEDFRQQIVSKVQSWFSTPIVGSRNGEQVIIKVNHVEILSQPVAALLDQYLAEDGTAQDESLEDSRTLMIDCGSGTMDLTELNGLAIVRQISLPVGMNDVYRGLLDALRRKNPKIRRCTIYDMESQFRRSFMSKEFVFESGKQSEELTEERERIMKATASQMISGVMAEFPDRADFDRIFLAGGTGEAFASQFQAAITGLEVCSEPQLAIARGLMKYSYSLHPEEA